MSVWISTVAWILRAYRALFNFLRLRTRPTQSQLNLRLYARKIHATVEIHTLIKTALKKEDINYGRKYRELNEQVESH